MIAPQIQGLDSKPSAVVFGGSGFLGSYVALELACRGYKVTIADIAPPKNLSKNQRFQRTDVQNQKDIESVIKDKDYVFNFIALANLDDAVKKPKESVNLNIVGNMSILESAKSCNIKRYIYASSVYAKNQKGSFYGISKYAAEQITKEYGLRYKIPYSIIRYGSVYGEQPSNNNYLYNLIKNAIKTGVISYKGQLSDVREYIHAADASKLSVDILTDESYENSTLTLTGVERLNRGELLEIIREILNGEVTIQKLSDSNFGHYSVSPYGFQSDVSKKLIANPFIDIGQGILQCVESIKNESEDDTGV